jgi:DNA polymerase-3 subunit delta'
MAKDDDPPARRDQIEGVPHPRFAARVFGQAAAEQAFLDSWASGRMPHGWLLTGPEGVGKATLAYRLARARLAHPGAPPQTLNAPPGCPVAARLRSEGEPGFRLLRCTPNPEKKNSADRNKVRQQIAVDDVRKARGFFELSRTDGGWRVMLVDDADRLNPSSANALLKLLEEPPAQTLFFLLSKAPGALLPTIRSRTRRLALAPLGVDDLMAALAQAGLGVPEGQAAVLTRLAGGAPGRAVALLNGGGAELHTRLVRLLVPGGVDRSGLMALVTSTSGVVQLDRARLVIALTVGIIGRLACAGATGDPSATASAEEAALAARVSATRAQAMVWAEAGARLMGAAEAALAVNLDPGQTILDMYLDLDAVLGRTAALDART